MNTFMTIALCAAPILLGIYLVFRSLGAFPMIFAKFVFDKEKGRVPNSFSQRIVAVISASLILVLAYYSIGFGFSNYPTNPKSYQLSACEQTHVDQFVNAENNNQLRIKHIDNAKKTCF